MESNTRASTDAVAFFASHLRRWDNKLILCGVRVNLSRHRLVVATDCRRRVRSHSPPIKRHISCVQARVCNRRLAKMSFHILNEIIDTCAAGFVVAACRAINEFSYYMWALVVCECIWRCLNVRGLRDCALCVLFSRACALKSSARTKWWMKSKRSAQTAEWMRETGKMCIHTYVCSALEEHGQHRRVRI